MKTFEPGKTYWTRSVCDHDCIYRITVASRTRCYIFTECGKKLKVRARPESEAVNPEGRYSMAPVISASDEIDSERAAAAWSAEVVAAGTVDARLVDAAPDLLEACRLAEEKLSSVTQPGESGWDAVMACRAAISKAEGDWSRSRRADPKVFVADDGTCH